MDESKDTLDETLESYAKNLDRELIRARGPLNGADEDTQLAAEQPREPGTHNILLADDYRGSFDDIFKRRTLPREASCRRV
ncbi:hypothetical protein GGR56DRAFT_672837 [Xylariaceae sp. FL0804]|nr:hypothetical protein GGR56DRAFT_672837 [Xylariaceae sp. FL0804]